MLKKNKLIIISILLILISGIGIGIELMFNKPHISVEQSKADIFVSANTFLNDFESNENKANTKYLEKIVEVTGTVSNLSINKDKGIITLENHGSMGNILCHLSQTETKKIKNINKGNSITIKGICTGYLMDIVLIKCVIENKQYK